MDGGLSMKNKKGQMFIVLAIIVVTALILIKNGLNITQVIENKRVLENSLEKLEFENFRGELINAASINVNSSTNITSDLISFIDFSKTIFSGKNEELQGLFVGSIYPNSTQNTDVRINVTVYNFFDFPIQTLNLNFSSNVLSNQTFTDIGPGKTAITNFTFNINANRNFSLHFYYVNNVESGRTENITVLAEINRTKFIGFYDIRLKGARLEQRDKFQQTVEVG